MDDMATTVLIGTDGSEHAAHAAATAARLFPGASLVVATAVEPADPTLVTGTGFAGGVMSSAAMAELVEDARRAGEELVGETLRATGIHAAATRVVEGDAGRALCALAEDIQATVLVVGSHGRGAVARALVGSVSHYAVQHAPCPVLVVRPA
jgi:nucleotide-binding universal stress UspA family protein